MSRAQHSTDDLSLACGRAPLPGGPSMLPSAERPTQKWGPIARFGRLIAAWVCGMVFVALASCHSASTPRDYKPTWARFFLEAGAGEGTAVTLPQSGVRVTVNAKPVITEGDIVNVELVQVELGKALMFQLTPSAARDFYRLSGSHQGRRIVLVVDGAPLGARRIDGAIANGVVFVFVELEESAMPALVQNLKKSAVALQKEIAKKE